MSIELTKSNFDAEIKSFAGLAIVDFWAEWCGPCRMMAPEIEQIAEERPDIKVCKVNIDENDDLANEFMVSAIPTVVLFRNGQVAAMSVGYKKKDDLIASLNL